VQRNWITPHRNRMQNQCQKPGAQKVIQALADKQLLPAKDNQPEVSWILGY
jgi:hypothetical protein